ncbi:MAG: phytanoyl-CoA dioxygenase family protein [Planctomycetaceae bacterium]
MTAVESQSAEFKTSNSLTDPYASRYGNTMEIADRADPVVWGSSRSELPAEFVEAYDRDGFVVLPDVFADDEVQRMLNEARELVQHWPDGQPGLVREPDSRVVRSVFRLHQLSELMNSVFSDARILGPVRRLLGSDVYIHQSRINYKPALDGREFFWHSDFETWHVEDGMPRMRAISMSLMLTDSHEFNGPLMLIPGSHRRYVRCPGLTPENHFEHSLRRQQYGVPPVEALEELVDAGGIVAPKGTAGSVILFDCNTMHGSAGNLSPSPRTNLFAVYNSVENHLTHPFSGQPPRPEYLAERDISEADILS